MEKVAAFDLETIADKAMLSLLPDVTANGTLKDPVKIAADVAAKKKKQVEEMGLNPLMNRICCAGWCDANGPHHIMLAEETDAAEKALLETWWEVAAGYDHFTTFNGRAFDMRCLMLHGMALGVRASVAIDRGRYNRAGSNHTDLRPILAGDDQFAKGKLDFFAKKFLGDQKTEGIDGALVQDYWDMQLYDEIGQYCRHDCELTYQLYLKAEAAGLLE